MKSGYILLVVLVISASVAGIYIYSQLDSEDFNEDDYPGPVTEQEPESGGNETEKNQDSSSIDRFEKLNMSCDFHDEVPDADREDITMRIEGRPLATHDSHLEGLMHKKTNEIREAQGLNPVKCDPQLVMVARNHSEDMAKRDFFSHINPDGKNPKDRAEKAGYVCPTGSLYMSENLHKNWYGKRVNDDVPAGYTVSETPEELARAAINSGLYQSPGHRRNMLREKWSVMGIGVYVTDDKAVYVTQMFC